MAGGLLSRFLARVTPRSDNYFNLFNELAALTVRGAKVLATMSSVRDQENFNRLFDEIKKTEGEADTVTRTILLSLHKTFITPFDREDIHLLSQKLDDIIDHIRRALGLPVDWDQEADETWTAQTAADPPSEGPIIPSPRNAHPEPVEGRGLAISPAQQIPPQDSG